MDRKTLAALVEFATVLLVVMADQSGTVPLKARVLNGATHAMLRTSQITWSAAIRLQRAYAREVTH